MAYSHPHVLTSCSTILDGLQPSPSIDVLFYNSGWPTAIPTNVADRGHLVEVEELYKHAVPKQKGGWVGHVFYNS